MTCKRQLGMTLIEIMIALLLGLFLLTGVIQIFLGSKQTYRMQENLSRLQENSRYAIDVLTTDIRMAGFLGCNSDLSLENTPTKTPNTLNSANSFLYDFNTRVQGFHYTATNGDTDDDSWTPNISTSVIPSSARYPESDIITIRRSQNESFDVKTHAASTDPITLANSATTTELKARGFLKSDGSNNCKLALVATCTTAAVFQITAISNTADLAHATTGSACLPGNAKDDLGSSFAKGKVYLIDTIRYYVSTDSNNGLPSLYRKINTANSEAIVEGVEKMTLLYGEDTDTTADDVANYYVSADKVVNWKNVVSVRITLTMISPDSNLTSNGGRISKDITTTIKIRN